MKKTNFIFILFLVLILSTVLVSATENKGIKEHNLTTISGIEIDNIITFIASIMALTLFGLTYQAYKRDGRKRLVYVAIAFLLFAIRGLLITLDVFYPQKAGWVDLTAALLDFAILLSFFVGILKK